MSTKPRERIAAIKARLVPGGMSLAGRPDEDLRWLLARLKRAEELLREWQQTDPVQETRAFLEGEE